MVCQSGKNIGWAACGLSGGISYGARSQRQYWAFCPEVSGGQAGGQCQDLWYGGAVFWSGFRGKKDCGKGGRYHLLGKPYPAVFYGSHGSLAGSDGCLWIVGKDSFFGRWIWKVWGNGCRGRLGRGSSPVLSEYCG